MSRSTCTVRVSYWVSLEFSLSLFVVPGSENFSVRVLQVGVPVVPVLVLPAVRGQDFGLFFLFRYVPTGPVQ